MLSPFEPSLGLNVSIAPVVFLSFDKTNKNYMIERRYVQLATRSNTSGTRDITKLLSPHLGIGNLEGPEGLF